MISKGFNNFKRYNLNSNLFNIKAASALHETMAFDNAIKATLEMVNLDETLIVVTADHGHTMTMSGYQSRGIDVRGISNLFGLVLKFLVLWLK